MYQIGELSARTEVPEKTIRYYESVGLLAPAPRSSTGYRHYSDATVEELRFILAHKWAQLGLTFSPDDFTDAEALAAIARITGGNFRLVQRLFTQIERILRINQLRSVTKEVVEAARETLLIGAT